MRTGGGGARGEMNLEKLHRVGKISISYKPAESRSLSFSVTVKAKEKEKEKKKT